MYSLLLATFALDYYGDDECVQFKPKVESDIVYSDKDLRLIAKMHKAIAIIQFKLEGHIIKRRPYFKMDDRLLLEKINYEEGTIDLYGKTYPLNDTNFPTIDPKNPYALNKDEEELIEKLKSSFLNSEKLQKHIRFLLAKGSMYLKYNSNLLYHGCIPVNEDGTFKKVKIGRTGKEYSGKEYFDRLEILVREGYFHKNNPDAQQYGMDVTWYLWTGPDSPLFGKDRMTTFERYFVDDKKTHKENKNHYFKLEDSEEMCRRIFEEFGLDPECSHIINGHVPVKSKSGESPIKANGKLIVIDGGFSRAYQSTTGIAGYTLIYNSYGLLLISHDPFESTQKAIEEEKDIHSTTMVLEKEVERKRVKDTDEGIVMKAKIKDLEMLLDAYRLGLIKEGVTDAERLNELISDETAAVIVQNPNFFGLLEDLKTLGEIAHKGKKVSMIASVNPISLALLKKPGELGVDVVVGEGQPLGIPLQFGGPYLGFMAVKKDYMRKLPGRIAGETTDLDGKRSYVLTLSARELITTSKDSSGKSMSSIGIQIYSIFPYFVLLFASLNIFCEISIPITDLAPFSTA
jgi:hypothetical protein